MALERYQCKDRTFDTIVDARRYALECIGFGFTFSALITAIPSAEIVGRVRKHDGRFIYESYKEDKNVYPVCKDGTLGKITKSESNDTCQ